MFSNWHRNNFVRFLFERSLRLKYAKKTPCWCILHLWKDLLEALQILKNSHVIWTVEPLIFFFLNFKFCGENPTLFWPNEWIYFCCFSCISDIYWIYYGLTIGFMKCCPSQVFRSIEEKWIAKNHCTYWLKYF